MYCTLHITTGTLNWLKLSLKTSGIWWNVCRLFQGPRCASGNTVFLQYRSQFVISRHNGIRVSCCFLLQTFSQSPNFHGWLRLQHIDDFRTYSIQWVATLSKYIDGWVLRSTWRWDIDADGTSICQCLLQHQRCCRRPASTKWMPRRCWCKEDIELGTEASNCHYRPSVETISCELFKCWANYVTAWSLCHPGVFNACNIKWNLFYDCNTKWNWEKWLHKHTAMNTHYIWDRTQLTFTELLMTAWPAQWHQLISLWKNQLKEENFCLDKGPLCEWLSVHPLCGTSSWQGLNPIKLAYNSNWPDSRLRTF